MKDMRYVCVQERLQQPKTTTERNETRRRARGGSGRSQRDGAQDERGASCCCVGSGGSSGGRRRGGAAARFEDAVQARLELRVQCFCGDRFRVSAHPAAVLTHCQIAHGVHDGVRSRQGRTDDAPACPRASRYSSLTACISSSSARNSASSCSSSAGPAALGPAGVVAGGGGGAEEGRASMRYSSCLALRRKSVTSSFWFAVGTRASVLASYRRAAAARGSESGPIVGSTERARGATDPRRRLAGRCAGWTG